MTEKKIVESVIFAAPEPVSLSLLSRMLGEKDKFVISIINELNHDYERTGRTFRIKEVAGGYSFYTVPEVSEFLQEAFPDKAYPSMPRSVIEVLAVVAMEQPATKKYVEKVRGVSCDQQFKKLMELGFITPVSRMNTPGRPYLFGTTQKFLKHFGLKRIEDIPTIEELKELLD